MNRYTLITILLVTITFGCSQKHEHLHYLEEADKNLLKVQSIIVENNNSIDNKNTTQLKEAWGTLSDNTRASVDPKDPVDKCYNPDCSKELRLFKEHFQSLKTTVQQAHKQPGININSLLNVDDLDRKN